VHNTLLHAELQLMNETSSKLISYINSKSCSCVNIQQLESTQMTSLHASTNTLVLLLKDAFGFCPCASLEVWLDT
jgi:hypothetical protein